MKTHSKTSGTVLMDGLEKIKTSLSELYDTLDNHAYELREAIRTVYELADDADDIMQEFDPDEKVPEDIVRAFKKLISGVDRMLEQLQGFAKDMEEISCTAEAISDECHEVLYEFQDAEAEEESSDDDETEE